MRSDSSLHQPAQASVISEFETRQQGD